MGKATSAFHLCRDFQRYEVPLPHFCSALTAKDLNFRSARTSKDLVHLLLLFCQDFQIWISPLPHFISTGLPKIRSSASALLLCLNCQRCKVLLPQFRRTYYALLHIFVLSWSLGRQNRNHLIQFSVSQAQKIFYMYSISSAKV